MAPNGTPDDGSGPDEVRLTMVVEPGRVRAMLTKLLARAPVRARFASVGLIAAVVAGTIIVATSSTGRERQSPGTRLPGSGAVERRFGIRVSCPRLTLVSPDGAYARVDFAPALPCGAYGNHVTLILHRIHGGWVHEFEGFGWTCPMRQLPQSVVTELGLCGPTAVPSRPVVQAPRGSL